MSKSSKSSRVQTPKGTRDFFPDSMAVQNHIFSIWRKICTNFGYEEYEGPMFEHLELYTQKSGDEIVKQLYNFKDKGGRDIALRPEITPTLARMVNQKVRELKIPVRWYSIPRLFRYERAQRGRLREFFQLNMDIVGCKGIHAEIDLISAVIEMLLAFGFKADDFFVGISSRALLSAWLEESVPAEAIPNVYAAFDKRDKLPREKFNQLLQNAGFNPDLISKIDELLYCSDVAALEKWAGSIRFRQAVDDLSRLFFQLKELGYGPFIKLDLSIVRGLAYYTGIVFEVFDAGKSLRAIAGGGRYDNLLAQLGGQSMSGVGFGIGDVVLHELLLEKNLLPDKKTGPDYFIVPFGELDMECLSLAQELRRKGRSVSYLLEKTKFKKHLSMAQSCGAKKVIFVGSNKSPAGQYEVKDLTTRKQFIKVIDDL